jgi:hypothetical protein
MNYQSDEIIQSRRYFLFFFVLVSFFVFFLHTMKSFILFFLLFLVAASGNDGWSRMLEFSNTYVAVVKNCSKNPVDSGTVPEPLRGTFEPVEQNAGAEVVFILLEINIGQSYVRRHHSKYQIINTWSSTDFLKKTESLLLVPSHEEFDSARNEIFIPVFDNGLSIVSFSAETPVHCVDHFDTVARELNFELTSVYADDIHNTTSPSPKLSMGAIIIISFFLWALLHL